MDRAVRIALLIFLGLFGAGIIAVSIMSSGGQEVESDLSEKELQEIALMMWWDESTPEEKATTCIIVKTMGEKEMRDVWEISEHLDFDRWYGFVKKECAP